MNSAIKIRNKIVLLSRNKKTFIAVLSDLLIFNLNFILSAFIYNFYYLENASLFRLDFPQLSYLLNYSFEEVLFLSMTSVFILFLFDGYKSFFRASGPLSILGAPRVFSLIVNVFLVFLFLFNKEFNIFDSLRIASMQLLYTLLYFLIFRTLVYIYLSKKSLSDTTPLIIYGAGQAGREVAASLSQTKQYNILGFIDDDNKLKNYTILGIKVIGNARKLEKIRKNYPNLLVIIAIQNITISERKRIISLLEPFEIEVKTIPAAYGGLETKLSIENISLDDLIERETGEIKNRLQSKNIKNKNVLITGAGGSIGSELAIQIANLNPAKIIFIDSSEYNLYKLSESFKTFKNFNSMTFLLKDIRDKKDMEYWIESEEIDSIFHAAAYKHVPLLQSKKNMDSALKNNFFATFNLCEIAYKKKIKSFTFISSDKAVNPSNIMGASKRLAELSLQSFQDLDDNLTCFSLVRFGNVLNSSGSVVPLFWDQIAKGGPLTVTHQEINRFFMTIEEAASLVIESNSISQGGEVFLLDMGSPIKIKDIAERMIRLSGNSVAREDQDNGIKIIYSGLRPGEKLYEELLLSKNPIDTENPKIKKGIEKKFTFDEIEKLKYDLENSINAKNISLTIELIKKYVDGFLS